MKRLEIALYSGAIAHAPGDTLVVFVPEDERPLCGDAGWVDWRLRGEISERLISGFVRGKPGEAALLPVRSAFGAKRLLLIGSGPSGALPGRALRRACCTAAEKLLGLGAAQGLVALPAAIELALDGDLILQSCIQVLSAARSESQLRLVIPDGRRRARALETAVTAVASDAKNRRVAIDVRWLEGS